MDPAPMLAHQIMTSPPITVTEATSLQETARVMLSRGVGSVLVTGEGGKLVGIITDDDFTAKTVPLPFSTAAAAKALGHWLNGGNLRVAYRQEAETPVAEFMTSSVRTVEENAPVQEVVTLMLDEEIHHVPVVRDGIPVGMITRRNLLHLLFSHVESGG